MRTPSQVRIEVALHCKKKSSLIYFRFFETVPSTLEWFIIYIYKEECLSVGLFAMHSHTVRPNATKLSTNDLYIQGKVDVYFVRQKNEPYRCCRQSVKLTNRIAVFFRRGIPLNSTPWSRRGQVSVGFRGRWVRIWDRLAWNPISWLRTNKNSSIEKSLNLNSIIAETVLQGFSETASSNSMSIRLENLLVG